MKRRLFGMLLIVLMLLTSLCLPASMGGMKEAEAASYSLDDCTEYPLDGIAKLLRNVDFKEYPYAGSRTIHAITTSDNQNMIVYGLWKNSSDLFFYKVQAHWGKTWADGYVFAGAAQITDVNPMGHFSVSKPASPSKINKGSGFHIKGTVKSDIYTITGIYAYVYKGKDVNPNYYGNVAVISSKVTGLSTKSYSLYNKAIDNNLKFGSLAVGDYTYALKVSFKYYYSKDGKSLDTGAFSVTIMEGPEPHTQNQWAVLSSNFSVVNTTSTPTVTSTEEGTFHVLMPANKKILLYKNPGDSNNSTYFSAKSESYYCICSKRAMLSDGTVWYFLTTGDNKKVWFKFSTDMVLDYDSTKEITVYFDPNGGSVDEKSIDVMVGEPYGDLPIPIRAGYSFDGWYTDTNGGTRVYASTTVTNNSDHTLYAHWYKAQYTILYDANGGYGAPPSQNKIQGEATCLSDIIPVRDATSAGRYTVYFDACGGIVNTSSLYADSYTYYDFLNWNLQRDGSGTSFAPGAWFTIDSGVILYAQWNMRSVVNSVILPTPSRDGYSFNGWYTSASSGTRIGGAGDHYTPNESLTIYAHWTTSHTHTASQPVKENVVAATCVKEGGYDEVTYCTGCGAELNRVHKVVPALGHNPGQPVKENEVPATTETEGSYDEVTYCTRCGAELSRVHKTTGKLPPAHVTFKTQPKSVTKKSGSKVTFKVKVKEKHVTYQWYGRAPGAKEWTKMPGGTKASFKLVVSKAYDGWQFRCGVTNDGEAFSNTVTLTVKPQPPKFSSQPKDIKAKIDAKVKFRAKASGKNVLYQWYYRTSEASGWVLIEGATKDKYEFIATADRFGWQFRCRAWNADGEIYSKVVTLRQK